MEYFLILVNYLALLGQWLYNAIFQVLIKWVPRRQMTNPEISFFQQQADLESQRYRNHALGPSPSPNPNIVQIQNQVPIQNQVQGQIQSQLQVPNLPQNQIQNYNRPYPIYRSMAETSSTGFIAESWRVKMVEKIRSSTRAERETWIKSVDYNLFNLTSDQVYIDLLTDSGTGAMSDSQWAAMMIGDETYAGSSSFARLEEGVKSIFGMDHVLPVHQGRAAENALFSAFLNHDSVVPGNTAFDTTRAHIECRKATAIDCPIDEAFKIDSKHLFKGNVDLQKLENVLVTHGDKVPMIIVTVTCNKSGGQPVSMENLRQVKAMAIQYNVPVVIDSARFAENAWFIQKRETGYADKSIREIVAEMYQYADAMMMSGKKDGLVNIGGLLATRHKAWFDKVVNFVILFEGFKTYGGLSGRDMDAFAVGLKEVVEQDYLNSRIGQVQKFGQMLLKADIPVQQPIGGHAVVIDASSFLPLIPKEEFVAQTLGIELYIEAGVRGVEIGTLLNGRDPDTGKDRYATTEFLRLAIPRRVYSNDQLAIVASALIKIYQKRLAIKRGFRIIEESDTLRHFTARLERYPDSVAITRSPCIEVVEKQEHAAVQVDPA